MRQSLTVMRFNDAGYASLRSRPQSINGGTVFLPDPCESAFVVARKTATTPTKPRLYLDLPGSNITRGLSSVPLKSAEEHGCMVRKDVAELMGKVWSAALDDDCFEGCDDEGEAKTDQSADLTVPLWPFTGSLTLARELLNMYSITSSGTSVVNWTAGFGQIEVACMLQNVHCSSFVTSKKHREV